jgi:glycosyltransferase involved in cell wall biosynthesis
MRVLLLANHVNYGGITAYLLNLCTSLHGQGGFEYVVASRGGELEDEFAKKGVPHIRVPLSTKCEISPKVFASFVRLLPVLKEYKIDCIHANTRVTQVLASFLRAASKKPFVSTCHGYFKPRLSRRLWPCWGQKVIAISDQVRTHLINDFHISPDSIALIYNGVDTAKFRSFGKEEIEAEKRRLGLDTSKMIIGHIGRLSSVKGQKYLVDAAAILSHRRNDTQFLIIGDGEQEDELRRLVRAKSLESVVFLRSSAKDISLALSLMDVFVMPSLQEGLGLSLLEAQGAGVPVVATRVGGIPTAVQDHVTGLLCPPADVDVLACAINELLDNRTLREALAANARKQIEEKFSLFGMAQKTLEVYKKAHA